MTMPTLKLAAELNQAGVATWLAWLFPLPGSS